MEISTVQFKNILQVKIKGEIDHHCSEKIREYVDAKFRQSGCTNIIFDFSEVNFMDSSGIGMLIGRYKNAGMKGGKLSVFGVSGNLERIFRVSGLYRIISVKENFEQCIDFIEG